MPLEQSVKNAVLAYCDQDLNNFDWYKQVFSFVKNESLKDRLALEYYSARYIYKLGEALYVSNDDNKLHSHAKFQIMQYASIYEAVISYFIFGEYLNHDCVKAIRFSKTYKKISALPGNITADNKENVYLCVKKKTEKSEVNIQFDSKVDAFVGIGFIKSDIGNEIKNFYKLRNGMHITTAVNRELNFDISMSRLAFETIYPFTTQIKDFIKSLHSDNPI